MMDSVGFLSLSVGKEVTVKSEAVTEANKLSASLQKTHITKNCVNWRQWTLGVIVWWNVKTGNLISFIIKCPLKGKFT